MKIIITVTLCVNDIYTKHAVTHDALIAPRDLLVGCVEDALMLEMRCVRKRGVFVW